MLSSQPDQPIKTIILNQLSHFNLKTDNLDYKNETELLDYWLNFLLNLSDDHPLTAQDTQAILQYKLPLACAFGRLLNKNPKLEQEVVGKLIKLQSKLAFQIFPPHAMLLYQMQELNYAIDEYGMCVPLTYAWDNAVLCDEEVNFEKRLDLLATTEDLALKIQAVKQKQAKNLTVGDEELLAILAFFDVNLLNKNDIDEIKNFFIGEVSSSLQKELISLTSNSQKLAARGGRRLLFSHPIILNREELKKYFIDLFTLIENENTEENKDGPRRNFTIHFDCEFHEVGLTFDPSSQQWRIFNVNRFSALTNKFFLADLLMEQYNIKQDENTCAKVEIFTTGDYVRFEKFKLILDKFKEYYPITAEVAQRTSPSNNCLAYCCLDPQNYTMLDTLLAHGANLDAKVCFNAEKNIYLTPLYFAAQHGLIEAIKILLKPECKVDINFKLQADAHYQHQTPLMNAAIHGHKEVVDLLLQAGAKPNIARKDGITALALAVSKSHLSIVKKLLAHNGNPNAPIYNGNLLMGAIFQNNAPILTALLHAGANPNQLVQVGCSALHYTAQFCDRLPLLQLLLKHHADVHLCNNEGHSSLFIAMTNNNFMAVIFMMLHVKDFQHIASTDRELIIQNSKVILEKLQKLINTEHTNSILLAKLQNIYHYVQAITNAAYVNKVIFSQTNLGIFKTIEGQYFKKRKLAHLDKVEIEQDNCKKIRLT